jgi:hydroxyacylglutathione hydrolase
MDMTPEAFAATKGDDSIDQILDVRTPSEFTTEHIEGALSFPLDDINRRMAELTPGKNYVVHCAGGYRSMIAASLLKARGFSQVTNLVGGIQGLKRVGYPLTNGHS